MVMVMVMSGTRSVGTGFRIERRLDRFDMSAETLDHLLDHVVGTDPNAIPKQLHGQMPVSQMPCDPHKFAIVMSVNFQQRFSGRARTRTIPPSSNARPSPSRNRTA